MTDLPSVGTPGDISSCRRCGLELFCTDLYVWIDKETRTPQSAVCFRTQQGRFELLHGHEPLSLLDE